MSWVVGSAGFENDGGLNCLSEVVGIMVGGLGYSTGLGFVLQ